MRINLNFFLKNCFQFSGILDIYVLEEETPEKLIQAYTSLIGKPYMPYVLSSFNNTIISALVLFLVLTGH
jgi:hypothetical protein